MTVACTIDVEEYSGAASRIDTVMNGILERFAERDVRITAFVIGDLAREHAGLVQRISAAGHEIGLHGPDHRLLSKWAPTEFVARCTDARAYLEDLTGSGVVGFRAPIFSLTPAVPWVPAALVESGFTYSSSVVPCRQSRGKSGFPGAPREPFRWRSGLVELPAGTYLRMPVGGAYLRLLPRVLVQRMHRGLPHRSPWVYVHPYDFDADEARRHLPGTGRIESRLLFARRHLMGERLERFLGGAAAPPLGEQVPGLLAEGQLPTFVPAARPDTSSGSGQSGSGQPGSGQPTSRR
jgi:peptidoglycan/xylan/chitin deacetylase (PgdA/CDA1 family)